MALATSGNINLTDVRDFYGQSGSINLTDLYKGGSYVPNPTSYNNGTQTTAAAAANSSIPTSGSIDLTDFYSGMRLVAPTVTSVTVNSRSGDTAYRNWVGERDGNPWYESGYAKNYATNSSVANYAQIFLMINWAYSASSSATDITIQVSHTGEYYVDALVNGNNSTGGTLTIGGSGTASGGTTDYALGYNTHREFTPTFTAGTDINLVTSSTAGQATLYMIRTNCNADNWTLGSGSGNNYMLTTS